MTFFPISIPCHCGSAWLPWALSMQQPALPLLTGKVGVRKQPFLGAVLHHRPLTLPLTPLWGLGSVEERGERLKMWPPKAARLAKLKPSLTIVCLESISSAPLKSLSKIFFPVEKRDDTLFRARGKTMACEHLRKLELRPSLRTAINHQTLCLSEDGGTNC